MRTLLFIVVQLLLIAVPVVLYVWSQVRVPGRGARTLLALPIATLTGSLAWLAGYLGWRPAMKSGRLLDLAPWELFWVHAGGVLLLLLILIHWPTANARQAARSPAPPRPEDPLHLRQRVFWPLITLHAAGLLAWPFMSFAALFAFGDPKADKVLVFYPAVSIWLYPAFLLAAWHFGHPRRNTRILMVALKANIPLLSALWYFLLPGLVGIVSAVFFGT
jgi:hypothetical protein